MVKEIKVGTIIRTTAIIDLGIDIGVEGEMVNWKKRTITRINKVSFMFFLKVVMMILKNLGWKIHLLRC